MNNVKLLNIKCLFFQFFNSQVALKNKKKIWPPQEKVEMTPLLSVLKFEAYKLLYSCSNNCRQSIESVQCEHSVD